MGCPARPIGTVVPNVSMDFLDIVAGLRNAASFSPKPLWSHTEGENSHERRPDGTGGDSIAADALFSDNLVGQRAHQANDSTFCCSVVDELRVSNGHVNRRVEVDRCTVWHVGDGRLRVHISVKPRCA